MFPAGHMVEPIKLMNEEIIQILELEGFAILLIRKGPKVRS